MTDSLQWPLAEIRSAIVAEMLFEGVRGSRRQCFIILTIRTLHYCPSDDGIIWPCRHIQVGHLCEDYQFNVLTTMHNLSYLLQQIRLSP